MWRAFDETGRLQYPDFVETVMRLMPMYWVRVAGGTLWIVGTCVGLYNLYRTWAKPPGCLRGAGHPGGAAVARVLR